MLEKEIPSAKKEQRNAVPQKLNQFLYHITKVPLGVIFQLSNNMKG